MLLSNCAVCGKKNRLRSKIKNSKILITFEMISLKWIKPLTILLTGDKFIPQFLLKYPEFTYSACGKFTKHRERIQKFRETDTLKHLYRNELDKACFAHDAAYSDSKDLAKRTISDTILKDRAYETGKSCKHDHLQKALASMAYKFFDKKTGSGVSVNEKTIIQKYKI